MNWPKIMSRVQCRPPKAYVTKVRERAWLGQELMTNKVRGNLADSDSSRRGSERGGDEFLTGRRG